jgi:hypothetical protein
MALTRFTAANTAPDLDGDVLRGGFEVIEAGPDVGEGLGQAHEHFFAVGSVDVVIGWAVVDRVEFVGVVHVAVLVRG